MALIDNLLTGCPKTSAAITNQHCVTPQKSEELVCTAAEA